MYSYDSSYVTIYYIHSQHNIHFQVLDIFCFYTLLYIYLIIYIICILYFYINLSIMHVAMRASYIIDHSISYIIQLHFYLLSSIQLASSLEPKRRSNNNQSASTTTTQYQLAWLAQYQYQLLLVLLVAKRYKIQYQIGRSAGATQLCCTTGDQPGG